MDEELKITVRNEEFVRKLTECQKAIQETKKEMEALYQQGKKGFSDAGKLNQNVKEMDALKKKLAEVTKEEEKLTKNSKDAGDSLDKIGDSTVKAGSSFGALVTKLGLAAVALQFLQKILQGVATAFKDTAAGANLMTRVSVIWKQTMYELAQGGKATTATFKELGKISDEINKSRERENYYLVENSKLENEYTDLLYKASDAKLSYKDKIDVLSKAQNVYNKLLGNELIVAEGNLKLVRDQLALAPKSLSFQKQEAEILKEIQDIKAGKSKRVEAQVTTAEEAARKEALQKYYDEIDERLKAQATFQAMSLKLADEADKKQIDMLTGNDRLRAQRDYDLKQIAEFKKQMEKLGKLTEEQERQFALWGAGVWSAFYKGLTKEADKPLPKKDIEAISKALVGTSDIVRKDIAAARKEIEDTIAANEAMEPFSVWKLLGIDPEDDEGAKQIEAIKEVAGTITGILEESLDQRVEIAQRERELLDTQISQLQNEIELEADLMEDGYANSLDGKKKELEGLKKQREQALKEEEAALKRQQAFERLSQAVSLATSVANLLKEFTKLGPLGLGLAAVAIGSLFAIWSAAKAKAAAGTKLAEGGSGTDTGIITGRRHVEGGERFLDHVEVERGEAFGVLSRQATGKYGNIFHEMVSSFNKNEMPSFVAPNVTNSVRVDNNGPNSRLDKVIREQKKLNESILKQTQQYNVGNKRIIKNGNKIRIVG